MVKKPVEYEIAQLADNSGLLTAKFTDVDGKSPISSASILTATMTLKDKLTKATINSRTAVDIKPNITDDVNGQATLLFTLDPEDNVFLDQATIDMEELHLAILKITANNGTKVITVERRILIHVYKEEGVS